LSTQRCFCIAGLASICWLSSSEKKVLVILFIILSSSPGKVKPFMRDFRRQVLSAQSYFTIILVFSGWFNCDIFANPAPIVLWKKSAIFVRYGWFPLRLNWCGDPKMTLFSDICQIAPRKS
jgi:hypothetical protein